MKASPITLFVLLGAAVSVGAVRQTTVNIPYPDIGEQSLAARRDAQLAAAQDLPAFHEFTFTDRLAESGITFRHRVVDDAAKSYKAAHYDHGSGLAVADVDGDQLLDLYFVTQIGSNELWRNLGDGRFENTTDSAGVGLADRIGVGASFADIDNDGDADLFTTSVRGGNALFENDGAGRFTDISARAGVDYTGHSSGSVFLDYDGDGLLDLFVTNVGSYTTDEQGAGGFWHARDDAFQGHLFADRAERSILYRNLGDNRFRDVSAQVGLIDNSWSGDASLVDFNGDGFPDLYVLSMQGDDNYYENHDGRAFAARTAALFPKTPWGAMGIKSFDYDNDGDLDLFLTDMHSDMSAEVPPEREFEKPVVENAERFYQDSSNNILGNAFYRNDGGSFTEISDAIGLENYWPWGTSVGDINADGYQDVFIASSMNYPFHYGINSMMLNVAGGHFAQAEFVLGIEPRRGGVRAPWFELDCSGADAAHPICRDHQGRVTVMGAVGSRTSALLDVDGDGDLDLITGEFNSAPQFLLSNLSDQRPIHWLQVELRGDFSNRDGLGAIVTVEAGGARYTQINDGKSGYLSQSRMPLYFGLGEATAVDRVTVDWPSGSEQPLEGPLPINQKLVIQEQ